MKEESKMNTDVIEKRYTWPVERAWFARHPVVVFVLLAFLISWLIWFLAPNWAGGDRYIFDSLVQIGSFGPAIAAWWVSAWLNPQPVRTSRPVKFGLFLLAYPVSLAIWWFGRPIMMEQATRGHWTDYAIAALPALIVSGFASGKQGVRDWLSSLRKWRIGAGPYLLAILLWPVLIVVGNALAPRLGFNVPDAPYDLSWRLLWLFPLNLLCIMFYGGGNEEPGWRGFAQPMLQKKFSPLVAGLLLGLVWALWHVPLNLNGYYSSGVSGLLTRLFTIPYGIFFAWMFNRSRGSLLPVWLLHGMSNNSGAFLPRADLPVFGLGFVLLILLVIKDKMWVPMKDQTDQERIEK
jgi:membrane protease YdiL (CAAX protease family)